MPIRGYLQDKAAFEPEAVHAMSQAFDQACTALASRLRTHSSSGALSPHALWDLPGLD